MGKKILYKFIKILISEFGDTYSVNDLYVEPDIYSTVFNFIYNDLAIDDIDKVDLIYSSFVETLIHLNGDYTDFNENDVIIPSKKIFNGEKSYYATVLYTEYYSHQTYLPAILHSLIIEYQIDEDNVEADIRDTWDEEVKIYPSKE